MIDITGVANNDITLSNTVVMRAKNLMNVQEGNLLYSPQWGIDLASFLTPEFKIENSAFESYSIQKISEWGMNPTNIESFKETLRQIINITFPFSKDDSLIGG